MQVMKRRKANNDPAAQPRSVDFGGQSWKIVPGARALAQVPGAPRDPSLKHSTLAADDSSKDPENYVTFLEFSVSGGYSRFGNEQFSNQVIFANIHLTEDALIKGLPLNAVTSLRPGWNVGGTATFNAHRYFSHELGFTYNRSVLKVSIENPLIPPSPVVGDADIRQFHYALLMHARPNRARFRPYIAVGGGMQMIRETGAREQGNGYLKFAFKEVNVLYSAFRFGGDPPLEGGGIFQPTLHYGGGVKYHLTPRLLLRADFRETLSKQPDFWTKSYPSLSASDLDNGDTLEPGPLNKYGPLRQQRASLGIGITF